MSTIPHPIPYQGSKRKLTPEILRYVPGDVATLHEPFCGSAAVSIAVATKDRARRLHISDSLGPLASLWQAIIQNPGDIASAYETIWLAQHDDPRAYYDAIRNEFNAEPCPAKLLFLLARCVKNAVRFNASGEFNQSPDTRRLGTRPARMRKNIFGASATLKGRTTVAAEDYGDVLSRARPGDLVYMDPPYQGTSGERDQRYHEQLDRERFVSELDRVLARGVPVIISFDGRCGHKVYGEQLPADLGLVRLDVHAGRSTQSTLNGGEDETIESLYVSPELIPAQRGKARRRASSGSRQPSLPGIG